ncbi:hypothetical protein Ae201684P_006631 [Aphanomyces euteiches]|uniref:Translation elongation factor EFG/EF2 domain-containing protein n=1 Tax=Aphanomyces euteiches TaxID=100861 RepID=A0A6G0WVE5_9STRA|nr:hypothetical protein Ae201684_011350 [Aphanomyces euteiches]KAH9100434.1 hypothetical protein Ae201684P_006631 [Aphanomyces euteiches]
MDSPDHRRLSEFLERTPNIRNISFIGSKGHGKATLRKLLQAQTGLDIDFLREYRVVDARPFASRSTALKPLVNYWTYQDDSNEHPYLIHALESMELPYNAANTLRMVDGVVVVLNALEIMTASTKILLRQAVNERVKPVLMLNKVDLALQLSPEECYQAFHKAIESANTAVALYSDPSLGPIEFDPIKGNVVFGSGLEEWGFTLDRFGAIFSSKYGMERDEFVSKLWGDWFFDTDTNKWTTSPQGGKWKRGFVQFVLDPIFELMVAVKTMDKAKLTEMTSSLGISLDVDSLKLKGTTLVQYILKKWLSLSDAVLSVVVQKLPSPVKAQRYRVETLYTGPLDDISAVGIRDCDSQGPLVMSICRIVQGMPTGRKYAFGRVFSGTLTTGQQIRLLGPNYSPDKRTDVWKLTVESIAVITGLAHLDHISKVPSGNICGILVPERFTFHLGTLTSSETCHVLRPIKLLPCTAVAQVAVEPKDVKDLPKMLSALRFLSSTSFLWHTEDTGEHVIEGTNFEHLNQSPVILHKETVTSTTDSPQCLAKSSNRHNRLFCVGSALANELVDAIESGVEQASAHFDRAQRASYLSDKHGWALEHGLNIWAYGPNNSGPNLLCNKTRGVMFLHEIKEYFVSGFNWATKCGVLCEDNVRGLRVNVVDVTMMSDAIHRGMGQILPTARRVVHACQLQSGPALVEPVFLTEIQCSQQEFDQVVSILTTHQAQLVDDYRRDGESVVNIKAFVAVKQASTLAQALQSQVDVFPHFSFDHYQIMEGDPVDPSTMAGETVQNIRLRKGLPPQVRPLQAYCDKL